MTFFWRLTRSRMLRQHYRRRRAERERDRIAARARAPAPAPAEAPAPAAAAAPAPAPPLTKRITPTDFKKALELPRQVTELIQGMIHEERIYVHVNGSNYHVKIGSNEPFHSGYKRSRISQASWSKIIFDAEFKIGDLLRFTTEMDEEMRLEVLLIERIAGGEQEQVFQGEAA